jgi:hypothetical protein
VKRQTAKEIIAHGIYQIYKEAGLDDYRTAQSDQDEAERIIIFFENFCLDTKGDSDKYDDYKMYQGICEAINDSNS